LAERRESKKEKAYTEIAEDAEFTEKKENPRPTYKTGTWGTRQE